MEMTVLRRSVLLVLLTAACAIATQANHANHVNLAKHANHANHANSAHRAKRANYVNHANLANRANQVVRGPARMPLLIGQTAERPVAARQPIEVHPRDGQHKEKFIRHLTGPLYFNPKCRKHFYRLYHNTRDCTVPTYYRRCALLLTRLAGTPRCSER